MIDRQPPVETAGKGSGQHTGRPRVHVGEGNTSSFLILYVVIVALSAAIFGGDEGAWGELVPIFGIGLLLLFCPGSILPNRTVLIGLGGLTLCGLLGFLPSRWFGEPLITPTERDTYI